MASRSKGNKTTARHFEVFQKEAWKWIRRFGLLNWDWCFEHAALPGLYAQAQWNITARNCTLTLAKDWEDMPVTNEQVRRSAFHEVCEVLLGPMTTLAGARFIGEYDLQEASHQVIRILENAVWAKG